MGWGLNSRACEERVKAQYVSCVDCPHCRPIGGGRNSCAVREGVVFWTKAPQLCRQHPTAIARKEFYDNLIKNKKGG